MFGGTSPYFGPPILYTPQQMQMIPDLDNTSATLIDHNDLYVLDMEPSLKTLCLDHAIQQRLVLRPGQVPNTVIDEIRDMTTDNGISRDLPFVNGPPLPLPEG